MKLTFDIKDQRIWFASIPVMAIIVSFIYLYENYQQLKFSAEYISIELEKPTQLHAPVAYITDSTSVGTNFYERFPLQKQNDSTFLIKLGREIKVRQFRIYFSDSIDRAMIYRIAIRNNDYASELPLMKFQSENLKIFHQAKGSLVFATIPDKDNAYIESPQFYYPSDYPALLIAATLVAMLSLVILFLINKTGLLDLHHNSLQELGVFVFIISFFLSQRIFNIAFLISFLLVLRNFRFWFFLQNRINIIFILFYLLFLLSFLSYYPAGRFNEIEKYLLFLVLPIYVSCIRNKTPFLYFCASALIIGGVLLGVSLIDISIFKNMEVISFSNFTRQIHPVYYSYLLMVSILYVEYHVVHKHKYIIQSALILLLILSGSKLIIFIIVLWFMIFVRKPMSVVISAIIILLLIIFTPTKERFGSILNVNDFSVINEQKISDPNDPRLNGFTLRVILWQESLRLHNVKELLFGKGVGSPGNSALKSNLELRGLTNHLEFNAHNQFVTMFQKTGIIGLILLISLLAYCVKLGLKTNNRLLIAFTFIMSFAMLSESVFERASGIAFFCMVVLLLVNSDFLIHNEQSKKELVENL